jgi:hypothetical protein
LINFNLVVAFLATEFINGHRKFSVSTGSFQTSGRPELYESARNHYKWDTVSQSGSGVQSSTFRLLITGPARA